MLKGRAALFYAIDNYDAFLVRAFLREGADPDTADKSVGGGGYGSSTGQSCSFVGDLLLVTIQWLSRNGHFSTRQPSSDTLSSWRPLSWRVQVSTTLETWAHTEGLTSILFIDGLEVVSIVCLVASEYLSRHFLEPHCLQQDS